MQSIRHVHPQPQMPPTRRPHEHADSLTHHRLPWTQSSGVHPLPLVQALPTACVLTRRLGFTVPRERRRVPRTADARSFASQALMTYARLARCTLPHKRPSRRRLACSGSLHLVRGLHIVPYQRQALCTSLRPGNLMGHLLSGDSMLHIPVAADWRAFVAGPQPTWPHARTVLGSAPGPAGVRECALGLNLVVRLERGTQTPTMPPSPRGCGVRVLPLHALFRYQRSAHNLWPVWALDVRVLWSLAARAVRVRHY
ncbi:hypothetical protein B0H10DRAFT_2212623 [Mycena sp. CBHHK59/15]|nr:hypothetical protein B0H10DRAFT_2212623 [Mycena sp. CBHHK59/15]